MIAIIICIFILCVISLLFSTLALAVACLVKVPQAMQVSSPEAPEHSTLDEDVPMFEEENPNKRIKKNPPFTPYPDLEDKEEEPFFDETDVNNTSHDLG